MSKIVFQEQYSKILDMEAIADQSYDVMEAYLLAKEEANKLHIEAGFLYRISDILVEFQVYEWDRKSNNSFLT